MAGRSLLVGGRRIDPRGRIVVLAAGKAGLAMAGEAARILGPRLDSGLVVTSDRGFGSGQSGRPLAARPLRILEAAHPLPDARGLAAATEVENLSGARHRRAGARRRARRGGLYRLATARIRAADDRDASSRVAAGGG